MKAKEALAKFNLWREEQCIQVVPVLSPMVGGRWMQISPQALIGEFISVISRGKRMPDASATDQNWEDCGVAAEGAESRYGGRPPWLLSEEEFMQMFAARLDSEPESSPQAILLDIQEQFQLDW